MSILLPNRRFDPHDPEMIDRPKNDLRLLEEDLRNLRTINKLFGGYSAVRKHILPFFNNVESTKPVEILDVATGSGDHPVELVKLGLKLGRDVRITAIDRSAQILDIARKRASGYPSIQLEQCDLLALPYPDRSFDIVLCSLAIHHFSREDAVEILRELQRLSRVGFIVNDLKRGWLGAGTAWLYTHCTTRNPLTLNDSYRSVLRAFSPDEMRSMAHEAALESFVVETRPFFRLILTGERGAY